MWKERKQPNVICLFDVDGTITPARKFISPEMMDTLKRLTKQCVVGFVGGSDLEKQKEQLGEEGICPAVEGVESPAYCYSTPATTTTTYSHSLGLKLFDYTFSENGLTAYKQGEFLASEVCLLLLSLG